MPSNQPRGGQRSGKCPGLALSPANIGADLATHVAVIPLILFGLIIAHLTLILQGIAVPL